MASIKILVATHKECQLPQSDIFLPIQVGRKIAEIKLDMQGDDEGDNISEKNLNFCELTAHYWAWKNLQNIDIIGLCHYRRYFYFNSPIFFFEDKKVIILKEISYNVLPSEEKIIKYMCDYDIILPKATIYPYDLKTNYCFEHLSEDFEIMNNVIKTKFPDYYDSFKYTMSRNKLNHYNMFITNIRIFDEYSNWIFQVLFEIEKIVKISEYPFQKRVFGYMSERLLMVYCHQRNLKIKYLPILFINESKNIESSIHSLLRRCKHNLTYKIGKI